MCASARIDIARSVRRSRRRACARSRSTPSCVNALKEWKLACPKGELDLVFPTEKGQIEHHANMLRGLAPAMVAAGLTDKTGRAEICPPRLPTFLRVVVHQTGRRRAGENCRRRWCRNCSGTSRS